MRGVLHGSNCMRNVGVILVCVSTLGRGVFAQAESPVASEQTFALSWHAPDNCSAPDVFVQNVALLGPKTNVRWHAPVTGAADSKARIVVRLEPNLARGSLSLQTDRSEWTRTVEGTTDCEALNQALAFALVVALDPTIGGQPDTTATLRQTANRSDLNPKPIVDSKPGPLQREETATTKPQPEAKWGLEGGLVLGPDIAWGMSDKPMFGGSAGLFGRVRDGVPKTLEFAPAIGVGVRFAHIDVENDVGAAEASVLAGALQLMPFVGRSPGFTWYPMLGAEFGSLRAEARAVDVSRPQRTRWSALTVQLGAEFPMALASVLISGGMAWHLNSPYFQIQNAAADSSELATVLRIGQVAGLLRLTFFVPLHRSKAGAQDISQ